MKRKELFEFGELFKKYLTEDSKTKDRRRTDYNQAIFDKYDGCACFSDTDLNMVLEKFERTIDAYILKQRNGE